MNEQEKEKALEDLKVIKAMMEAANQVVAHNGIFFILFGLYWIVATVIFHIPAFQKGIESAPHIFVPIWLGFILICTILMALYCRREPKRSLQQRRSSSTSLRYNKQMKEGILAFLVSFYLGFFSAKIGGLNIDLAITYFIICLVMGMAYYFFGVFWAGEFRIVGLFLFAGMVAVCFFRGFEQLVFGLTFGTGMILTGIFMHRRWLKLQREEPSVVILEDQNKK